MSYSALTPVDDRSSWLPSSLASDGAWQSFSSNQNTANQLAGLPWGAPDRLTISFAPDGTRISNYDSSLYAAFRDLMTANQLEAQILRAFQRWNRYTSINVGLVADSGLQFGTSAPTQGDSRFGDIRIGAIPMAEDVYAVSIKHDVLMSGSWAGEILFNSNKTFSSVDEFYAVALHEAGHVLGLEHSQDPRSVMYPGGLSTSISGLDVTNIRNLHGVRRLDLNDVGTRHNNTIDKATKIKNSGSLNGEIPLIVYGDIHLPTDVDYFELPPLSGYTGPVKFELISSGISLLKARLSLFDEDGRFIQSSVMSGVRGGRISVTIPAALPGETYFAKVEAIDDSLQSTGSYALKATFENNLRSDSALIEKVLQGKYWHLKQDDVQAIFLNPQEYHFNAELQLNDTFLTAEQLKTSAPHKTLRHYQAFGSFSYLNDVDFYQLKTATSLPAGNIMTVSLNVLGDIQLVPKIEVYDANRVLLTAKTLVNGNGQLTLQVPGVQPNQDYFVRLTADYPGDRFDTGNYQFWARFDQPAVSVERLAQGRLSTADLNGRQQYHALYVAETQMFHLSLTASTEHTRTEAQVWVTIYDKLGKPVFRNLTVPGQTRTAKSVVLRPGSYTVFVSLAASPIGPDKQLNYTIDGVGITDPVGPEIIDPSKKPFQKAGPNDPNYVYPGNLHSPRTFVVVPGNPGVTPPSSIQAPPQVDANAWYWYRNWLTQNVPPM